jgi:hypothetical protein
MHHWSSLPVIYISSHDFHVGSISPLSANRTIELVPELLNREIIEIIYHLISHVIIYY